VARKKQVVVNYVMFDVFYQDGTRSSHRKVPAAEPYEQDFESPHVSFLIAEHEAFVRIVARHGRLHPRSRRVRHIAQD